MTGHINFCDCRGQGTTAFGTGLTFAVLLHWGCEANLM